MHKGSAPCSSLISSPQARLDAVTSQLREERQLRQKAEEELIKVPGRMMPDCTLRSWCWARRHSWMQPPPSKSHSRLPPGLPYSPPHSCNCPAMRTAGAAGQGERGPGAGGAGDCEDPKAARHHPKASPRPQPAAQADATHVEQLDEVGEGGEALVHAVRSRNGVRPVPKAWLLDWTHLPWQLPQAHLVGAGGTVVLEWGRAPRGTG